MPSMSQREYSLDVRDISDMQKKKNYHSLDMPSPSISTPLVYVHTFSETVTSSLDGSWTVSSFQSLLCRGLWHVTMLLLTRWHDVWCIYMMILPLCSRFLRQSVFLLSFSRCDRKHLLFPSIKLKCLLSTMEREGNHLLPQNYWYYFHGLSILKRYLSGIVKPDDDYDDERDHESSSSVWTVQFSIPSPLSPQSSGNVFLPERNLWQW